MRKKIVMYFNKRKMATDPFSDLGKKRDVYHYFFKKGRRMGFDMYAASGKENYLGDLCFKDAFRYDGKKFKHTIETIKASAVYDRNGSMSFPNKEIGPYTLNCIEFKKLCNNKNLTKKVIGQFMPTSFAIKNQDSLIRKLKNFKNDALAVLKPAKGMCGKNIVIDYPNNLRKINLEKNTEYVLQEFVDTSGGISKIINKKHDLRIVLVNGKIVLAHVRTPKKGSLLANVAQGGRLKEVPLNKIPRKIIEVTRKINSLINKRYLSPVYSIDFGIGPERPYVFELNDQIGFPAKNMKNAKNFIDAVLLSLAKKVR